MTTRSRMVCLIVIWLPRAILNLFRSKDQFQSLPVSYVILPFQKPSESDRNTCYRWLDMIGQNAIKPKDCLKVALQINAVWIRTYDACTNRYNKQSWGSKFVCCCQHIHESVRMMLLWEHVKENLKAISFF
jgi:hypothetical protein